MLRKTAVLGLILSGAFLLVGLSAAAQSPDDSVEVSVDDIGATPAGVSIILREPGSRDAIHMMIGLTEGRAIVRALHQQEAPRPMTHDLLKSVLDRNGWKVEKVLIRDLSRGTFLADLILLKDGERQIYDMRPSDAMAIGLLYGAKIFVRREVFDLERQGREGREDSPRQESEDPETKTLHL